MRADNTIRRYGAIAILLHWAMALLLVGLVAMGLYMTRLPDAGFDKTKILLIMYHKEFGILALGLVGVRWGWRFGNVKPGLVDMPEWQKVAARFVHLCFYAFMIALPLSGWLMSSAAGFPVSFFGLFFLPDLVDYNERQFQFFLALHRFLGWALIPLIAVHVGAALAHHFIHRDESLRKMLPAGPA